MGLIILIIAYLAIGAFVGWFFQYEIDEQVIIHPIIIMAIIWLPIIIFSVIIALLSIWVNRIKEIKKELTEKDAHVL